MQTNFKSKTRNAPKGGGWMVNKSETTSATTGDEFSSITSLRRSYRRNLSSAKSRPMTG